jgi:hypothetical protein
VPTKGTGLACEALSGLVVVMVGDVCRVKGSFPGCRYRLEVLSSLVHVHGISHSKMNSYQAVITPWQGHDVIQACSLGIATSGSARMDSLLECSVPGAC